MLTVQCGMIWLSGLPSSRCVLQSLIVSLANCRVDRQDEVKAILSICTIYTSSPDLVLREALFHDLFVGYLRSKKPPQLIGVHFDCMSLATWVCARKKTYISILRRSRSATVFTKPETELQNSPQ